MTPAELEAKKLRYSAKLHFVEAFNCYSQAETLDPQNTQIRIEEAVTALSKIIAPLKAKLQSKDAAIADYTRLKSEHAEAMIQNAKLKADAAEDAENVKWLEQFLAANPDVETPAAAVAAK
jgi:hypothetical protein